MVASFIADAIVEGRKRFLSYLSQEGVAIKQEEKLAQPTLLPEEEAKIREIEEIVEIAKPEEEEVKPSKKGRTGQSRKKE